MLEKSIEQLKINYDESIVESNTIKQNMEEVKNKVERSEKLLINLSSEKDRWTKQMDEFKVHINNLLGDTFLSSAFLAYIGFYDAFYRKYLKEKEEENINNYNKYAQEKNIRENGPKDNDKSNIEYQFKGSFHDNTNKNNIEMIEKMKITESGPRDSKRRDIQPKFNSNENKNFSFNKNIKQNEQQYIN